VCTSERACMSTCGVCVCAVLSDLIWERHSFGEVLSHLDSRMCTISASLILFLSLWCLIGKVLLCAALPRLTVWKVLASNLHFLSNSGERAMG